MQVSLSTGHAKKAFYQNVLDAEKRIISEQAAIGTVMNHPIDLTSCPPSPRSTGSESRRSDESTPATSPIAPPREVELPEAPTEGRSTIQFRPSTVINNSNHGADTQRSSFPRHLVPSPGHKSKEEMDIEESLDAFLAGIADEEDEGDGDEAERPGPGAWDLEIIDSP